MHVASSSLPLDHTVRSFRPQTAEATAQQQGSGGIHGFPVSASNTATRIELSDGAKLLLARANAEHTVVQQLQAQINALRHAASSMGLGRPFDILDNVTITTGSGDDVITALSHATINAGDGNNKVSTYNHSTVTTGAGDDVVDTYGWSTVNAGDGNNRVSTYNHSTVTTGAGDDVVDTYGWSTVNAGDGNNRVSTYNHSTVTTGAGNDVINTGNTSTIFAGGGDDIITTAGWSTVQGGAGNDTIRVGTLSTVMFGRGDGRDEIHVNGRVTLQISGYSASDVTVTRDGDNAVLSFKGSEDSITLKLDAGSSATLKFTDQAALDIKV